MLACLEKVTLTPRQVFLGIMSVLLVLGVFLFTYLDSPHLVIVASYCPPCAANFNIASALGNSSDIDTGNKSLPDSETRPFLPPFPPPISSQRRNRSLFNSEMKTRFYFCKYIFDNWDNFSFPRPTPSPSPSLNNTIINGTKPPYNASKYLDNLYEAYRRCSSILVLQDWTFHWSMFIPYKGPRGEIVFAQMILNSLNRLGYSFIISEERDFVTNIYELDESIRLMIVNEGFLGGDYITDTFWKERFQHNNWRARLATQIYWGVRDGSRKRCHGKRGCGNIPYQNFLSPLRGFGSVIGMTSECSVGGAILPTPSDFSVLLYGKSLEYFLNPVSWNQTFWVNLTQIFPGIKLWMTLDSKDFAKLAPEVQAVVKNRGKMVRSEWLQALRDTTVILGMRDPRDGPSIIEGWCHGVFYINPIFETNNVTAEEVPGLCAQRNQLYREAKVPLPPLLYPLTQHKWAEEVDQPWAYHVRLKNYTQLIAALKDIQRRVTAPGYQRVSFVPELATHQSFDERLTAVIERNFSDINWDLP